MMKRITVMLMSLSVLAAINLPAQTMGGAIAHRNFTQIWGALRLGKGWSVEPQYLHMTKGTHGEKDHGNKAAKLGILQIGRNFSWGEHGHSNFTLSGGAVTDGTKAGLALGERLGYALPRRWELESHVTLVKLTGGTFLASEPLVELTRPLVWKLRAGGGVDVDYGFEKLHVEAGPVVSLVFRRTLLGGQLLLGREKEEAGSHATARTATTVGWKVFFVHRF